MKRILFICTHNRCRSILAQAITNHINDKRIIAESAGAEPAGQIHPLTLKNLEQRNISTADLHSKSWDTLSAFTPEIVITVCDQAANESCPVWLGNAQKVHWGLPDPSRKTPQQDSDLAFAHVIETLESRMRFVLCHDIEKMNTKQLTTVFLNALENN